MEGVPSGPFTGVRTQEEVGRMLGIDRKLVAKIEKRALAKLKLLLTPDMGDIDDDVSTNELFRSLSPSVERLEFIRSNRTSTD